MSKQEFEICDIDLLGTWRQSPGATKGILEKILSYDSETGNYTRILKFPPGTVVDCVLVHDFCEEVFILEGYLYDTDKKLTMKAGYYGCRLPGMKHGPYEIPLGCVTMEFRYQDPGKPINKDCSLIRDNLGAPEQQ